MLMLPSWKEIPALLTLMEDLKICWIKMNQELLQWLFQVTNQKLV